MFSRIRAWLGIDKRTQYVDNYFHAVNMRASIYMSIVVIILEIFMIVLRYEEMHRNGINLNINYLWDNYQSFIIPLAASIIMLIVSALYMAGKKIPPFFASTVVWLFSAACIYYGMKTSYDDFNHGNQILIFLTMVIFVVCLLTWRPIMGLLILFAAYGLFIYSIDGLDTLGKTNLINLLIMGIATLIFCVSNYMAVRKQALKDEKLETVNAYLTKTAVSDDLTGINNMSYFRNVTEQMLADPKTDNSSKLFLFLDIENFKSFNNKYGFEKGSELLKSFASKILVAFSGSMVARFSDDHFVVFTKSDRARLTVFELSDELHKLQEDVHLELKCGAYRPEKDDTDAAACCDKARFACNSIKKKYREFFFEYDEKLADKFKLSQYVVNNIDVAILAGYIKVYYQPVVSTKTGGICGLEALARWQDPEYGLLPPGKFIETLEEYRQIHKLDMFIVEQVCKDMRESVDAGRPVVPVSLNFSRLDFELCDMTGHLDLMQQKYGIDKHFLEVEITESALTDTQDFLRTNMDALRELGYNLWLDDFGSGYSSLNVLKDYHFDVLKIDMMFLVGFGDNENTKTIIKVIVDMTKQLGIISLCEGVETKEQYDFLASIGCDRTQGYYFSKPSPKDDLRGKVADGRLYITPEFAEPQDKRFGFPPEEESEIINRLNLKGIMTEQALVAVANKELITAMIKDINRSRSIQDIAKRHNIPVQLSEAICRMYLTHPGIGAEEVMEKLGL